MPFPVEQLAEPAVLPAKRNGEVAPVLVAWSLPERWLRDAPYRVAVSATKMLVHLGAEIPIGGLRLTAPVLRALRGYLRAGAREIGLAAHPDAEVLWVECPPHVLDGPGLTEYPWPIQAAIGVLAGLALGILAGAMLSLAVVSAVAR